MIPYSGLDLQSVIINEIGQLFSSLTICVSSSVESLFMSFVCFLLIGIFSLFFLFCLSFFFLIFIGV